MYIDSHNDLTLVEVDGHLYVEDMDGFSASLLCAYHEGELSHTRTTEMRQLTDEELDVLSIWCDEHVH